MKISNQVRNFIKRKRPRDVWSLREEELFLQYFLDKKDIMVKNMYDNIKNKDKVVFKKHGIFQKLVMFLPKKTKEQIK